MTQRLHGQQQILLAQDTYPFMPASHQASRTTLLDNDERGYIESFFENPEDVVNQSSLLSDSSYVLNPFAFASEASANDMSHVSNNHMQGSNSQMLYPGQQEHWLNATHEVQNAASALAGFQSSTTMQTPEPGSAYSGSWGNVNSANGFQDTGAGPSNQAQRNSLYTYPIPSANFQPPSWHNQQVYQYPHLQQRARHLSLDTTSPRFQVQQRQLQQSSMSAVLDPTQDRPAAVRFGSDDNFSNGHYQVPVIQRSQRDRSGGLLNMPFAADAIHTESPTSASPSRPVPSKRHDIALSREGDLPDLPTPTSANQHSSLWSGVGRMTVEVDDDSDDLQDQQPRKRRKAATGENASKKKHSRDRSPVVENHPSSTGDAKRRKSVQPHVSSPQSPTSSGPEDEGEEVSSSARKRKDKKQPRQNLSDKQKRENHIMSEKKRRQLIKTGYADLNKLVPALAGGKNGMSRSESLFECQTYLESLIVGTQQIMKELGISEKELCARVGVEVGAISLDSNKHPD